MSDYEGSNPIFFPKSMGHALFSGTFLVLYLGIFIPKHLLLTSPQWAVIVDGAVHVGIPLAIVLALRFSGKAFFGTAGKTELKWHAPSIAVSILLGLACCLITSWTIAELMQYVNPPMMDLPSFSKYAIEQFGLFGSLYLALSAGVFEEWLFKSVLIRSFRTEPSQLAFVAISAALFGLAHYGQGLVPMFVYGILWGVPSAIYYYQERNISNLIVIHVTMDLVIFLSI